MFVRNARPSTDRFESQLKNTKVIPTVKKYYIPK